jgi:hypothetical protein
LVDDDDDEWVVAEKGNGNEGTNKGRSWSEWYVKQRSHTTSKKSFCQKGGKHPKTPAFKKSQPWGRGEGGAQQIAHDLLIIYMYCTIFIEISWSAFFRIIWTQYNVPNLLLLLLHTN